LPQAQALRPHFQARQVQLAVRSAAELKQYQVDLRVL
jgi:hypothetical protein